MNATPALQPHRTFSPTETPFSAGWFMDSVDARPALLNQAPVVAQPAPRPFPWVTVLLAAGTVLALGAASAVMGFVGLAFLLLG